MGGHDMTGFQRIRRQESVVFLQVSTMVSRGARGSRDSVSGLLISLNKGVMGWGNTDLDREAVQGQGHFL